jgi:hypothetical protein
MNELEKIELAFDLLADDELTQEFENCVWSKFAKSMWDEFNNKEH